jgi:hypothetical protein
MDTFLTLLPLALAAIIIGCLHYAQLVWSTKYLHPLVKPPLEAQVEQLTSQVTELESRIARTEIASGLKRTSRQ